MNIMITKDGNDNDDNDNKAYIVIRNEYLDDFIKGVNDAVSMGYHTTGGIAISNCDRGQTYYYQSMIKW